MSRLYNTTIAVFFVTAFLSGVLAAADTQDPEANATSVQEVSAAPPTCDGSWRAARLRCARNSTGLATGNYGGTDFFLTCGGESSVTFCTGGNTFRYIMEGQSSDGRAVRCALSGSAGQVNEKCGPLHLIIN